MSCIRVWVRYGMSLYEYSSPSSLMGYSATWNNFEKNDKSLCLKNYSEQSLFHLKIFLLSTEIVLRLFLTFYYI